MEKIKKLSETEFRKLAEEKNWTPEEIDSFISDVKESIADMKKAGLNTSYESHLAIEYETFVKDGPFQVETYPI